MKYNFKHMKPIAIIIGIVLLFGASSCEKSTCTCEDAFGNVQTGIEITHSEECSDLEPMMGECTEE